MRRAGILNAVVLLAATATLICGWRVFWFLCDDAYIQFRYASNSLLGHGYTWNPPPFLPVEGYTSFLWVVLLDLTWRITGVEPPEFANGIALCFSILTLLLLARMVLAMPLRRELAAWRPAFLALVLLGVVSNRTFLAWSSSGLETAMFNTWVLLWLYVAYPFTERGSVRRATALCTTALLIYLTRPDGLLFGAATLAMIVGWWLANGRRDGLALARLLAATPLAAIPVHLLWRYRFYGEWLPNTYYAKHVSSWPAAGIRYALSFTLEYALWVWAALLLLLAPRLLRQLPGALLRPSKRLGVLALVALLGQVTYYTFAIGGDHFEYRVYSHLVPLLFLSFLWLLNRSQLRPAAAAGTLALFVAASWPIPWIHWRLSRASSLDDTFAQVLVAPALPGPLQWYGRVFDDAQSWLAGRLICYRHHAHQRFCLDELEAYPPRREGERVSADGHPVLFLGSVGVAGWSLPHVAILDTRGLNDWVVARTPSSRALRRMAHERRPPLGYVADFRPNVGRAPAEARITVRERETPLTAQDIIELEAAWRRRVRGWEREEDLRPDDERPAVMIFQLDHLAPERLGFFGYEPAETPHLDSLLAESFLFVNAESTAPHTAPATASLMTALYPEVHGVRAGPDPLPLDHGVVTLAEVLQGAGYSTAGFTACPELARDLGLDRGFDLFLEEQGPGGSIVARARAWLDARDTGSFFIYFHPDQPHPPHDDYDRQLTRADEQLGALLDELDERAIIVLIGARDADLGDGRLDERLAPLERLPTLLAIRAPGSFFTGRELGEFASTVDVAPTLLELMSLDPGQLAPQGRSLVPSIRGESSRLGGALSHDAASGLSALRLGRWTLFLDEHSGRRWLYSRRGVRDVLADRPDIAEPLTQVLRRELALRQASNERAWARLDGR